MSSEVETCSVAGSNPNDPPCSPLVLLLPLAGLGPRLPYMVMSLFRRGYWSVFGQWSVCPSAPFWCPSFPLSPTGFLVVPYRPILKRSRAGHFGGQPVEPSCLPSASPPRRPRAAQAGAPCAVPAPGAVTHFFLRRAPSLPFPPSNNRPTATVRSFSNR